MWKLVSNDFNGNCMSRSGRWTTRTAIRTRLMGIGCSDVNMELTFCNVTSRKHASQRTELNSQFFTSCFISSCSCVHRLVLEDRVFFLWVVLFCGHCTVLEKPCISRTFSWQECFVVFKDGRYILPIRTDHKELPSSDRLIWPTCAGDNLHQESNHKVIFRRS